MTFPKGEMVQNLQSKWTYWVVNPDPLHLVSVNGRKRVRNANPTKYRVVPRLGMDDADMLVFLHIPRCGGTTITSILAQEYMVWRVGEDIIPSLRNLDRGGVIKDVECLAGHLPYGVHLFVSHRCHYVTILRDPIERITSAYYFFRDRDGWDREKQPLKLLADSLDLDEFARQPRAELDNAMVRYVAGMRVSGNVVDRVDYSDVEVAISHLNKFKLVGFLKTLERDVTRLAENFNWTVTPKYGYSNSSGRPKQIDPEIRKEITEINQWDMALYQYAQERFGG